MNLHKIHTPVPRNEKDLRRKGNRKACKKETELSVESMAETPDLTGSLGFSKVRATVVTGSWFGRGLLLRFLDERGVRYLVGVARSRNVRFSGR
ncbi:MAG: hypothetical protein ACTSXX_10500 [Candidatus Baldrarchaeia archaeon]